MGDRLTRGGWGHLAARFFESARARPLGPREQSEVAALLRPEEEALFWGQSVADQRHGLEAARGVLRWVPGRRDLARAALLHDVGKQVAGLGTVGRVAAALLVRFGLPGPGRVRTHLGHGEEGARMLERAGSEDLVVGFARHHHGPPPPGSDPGEWEILTRSDRSGGESHRRIRAGR